MALREAWDANELPFLGAITPASDSYLVIALLVSTVYLIALHIACVLFPLGVYAYTLWGFIVLYLLLHIICF